MNRAPLTHVGRVRKLLAAGLAAVALTGLAACGSDEGAELGEEADIVIDNQGFKPKEAQVKVGEEVVFSVINNDSRAHTFTLTFLDIDQPIAPGQRVDIKLKAPEVPPAGFYSFYSKDHQHEGYQGKINVEE